MVQLHSCCWLEGAELLSPGLKIAEADTVGSGDCRKQGVREDHVVAFGCR